MKSLEAMNEEEIRKFVKNLNTQMNLYMKREQKNKVKSYQYLNQCAQKGQILFTGSSLMEQFPINEIAMSDGLDKVIYNRGIGGITTDDFLAEIDTVLFDLRPSKIFINIGTNDFAERADGQDWEEHLLLNYNEILRQIKKRLSETEVYVMAYYPVNDNIQSAAAESLLAVRTNKNLNLVNVKLEKLADKYGYHYIDANSGIKDEQGRLRRELTIEGVHMYAEAYQIIYESLKTYL